MNQAHQLLFADDHQVVRQAISHFLAATAPNLRVHQAGTVDESITILSTTQIDLVLLDLDMPGMEGFKGLDRLREAVPRVPVAIFTGDANRQRPEEAMARGAAGFIPKTISGPALLGALQLVLHGEKFLPAVAPHDGTGPRSKGPETASPKFNLSPREHRSLLLVSQGLTNKEIARELGVAEVTVKLHLHNAFRKIGAKSRADATRIMLTG